jgi:serine/threonine protein kinase
MAPEMVLNADLLKYRETFYSTKVDVWSYGVCLYQLLYNTHPYVQVNNMEDLNNLCQNEFQKYIDMTLSGNNQTEFSHFIKELLIVDPNRRSTIKNAFDMLSVYDKCFYDICIDATSGDIPNTVVQESWESVILTDCDVKRRKGWIDWVKKLVCG